MDTEYTWLSITSATYKDWKLYCKLVFEFRPLFYFPTFTSLNPVYIGRETTRASFSRLLRASRLILDLDLALNVKKITEWILSLFWLLYNKFEKG